MGDLGRLFPKILFHGNEKTNKRDTITELLLDDDTRITGDAPIMTELTRFYSELFAKDQHNAPTQPGPLKANLETVTQTLSPQAIRTLERTPSK